jgi:hypothetical protein
MVDAVSVEMVVEHEKEVQGGGERRERGFPQTSMDENTAYFTFTRCC